MSEQQPEPKLLDPPARLIGHADEVTWKLPDAKDGGGTEEAPPPPPPPD